MTKKSPEAVEQDFFTALIEADVERLSEVLADDFLLIDVMSGSEVARSSLLELVGAGQLRFAGIDRSEHRVRLYGTSAVITGRTDMQGIFGEEAFRVQSRYTHVFVDEGGYWRMVAAQGTQISIPPAAA